MINNNTGLVKFIAKITIQRTVTLLSSHSGDVENSSFPGHDTVIGQLWEMRLMLVADGYGFGHLLPTSAMSR